MNAIFSYLKRHREMLFMTVTGLLVMVSLNVLMLQYHYDMWTNPKVGFWSAFFGRFEMSGFDSYTYITVSSWRPLYVLFRHPLLAAMVWPLSELNSYLMGEYHMNFAIFIVAVVWTLMAVASWLLMFRILRRLIRLPFAVSALLTAWFFSFSHIMLVTFTPDHMSITLPLLLLTVLLAGKAIERGKAMPLWQSLALAFVSTGVTTTNLVKIVLADLATLWGRKPFKRIVLHFMAYLLPLAVLGVCYFYQQETTQVEESKHVNKIMATMASRDSAFAKHWEEDKAIRKKMREQQLFQFSGVTNTEHCIDRLPSLVENIFGEGFILHDDYVLMDANKTRPALVRYRHWWYYAFEGVTVSLFVLGVWFSRRQRLVWMTVGMFLFDMLLHVGLEFANSDAYIMTAHWAFALPIAVGYMLKRAEKHTVPYAVILLAVAILTAFQWWHNVLLTANHILG